MSVWVIALLTCIITGVLTAILIPVARRLRLVDEPFTVPRKTHARHMPLVGGVAVVGGTVMGIVLLMWRAPHLIPSLTAVQWWAIGGALVVLLVGGAIDDRWSISPARQFVAPVIALLLLVGAGFSIRAVTHPAGGVFVITSVWISFALTAAWLLGMMYSTKLLDGLDGVATGMTIIGALMVFALTHTARFWEPALGAMALLVAGAFFGFLIFNVAPARAFLGEGGSLIAGLLLALLAILSGSKIATALIVMAIPVFDVARVIATRVWRGRSPFRGDQLHLHHLLIRAGVSSRAVVLGYWSAGASGGVLALVLPTSGKILLLVILCAMVWWCGVRLARRVS